MVGFQAGEVSRCQKGRLTGRRVVAALDDEGTQRAQEQFAHRLCFCGVCLGSVQWRILYLAVCEIFACDTLIVYTALQDYTHRVIFRATGR